MTPNSHASFEEWKVKCKEQQAAETWMTNSNLDEREVFWLMAMLPKLTSCLCN